MHTFDHIEQHDNCGAKIGHVMAKCFKIHLYVGQIPLKNNAILIISSEVQVHQESL